MNLHADGDNGEYDGGGCGGGGGGGVHNPFSFGKIRPDKETLKYCSVFAKLLPQCNISLCQIVFTIKSSLSENYNNYCALEILIYCNLFESTW